MGDICSSKEKRKSAVKQINPKKVGKAEEKSVLLYM